MLNSIIPQSTNEVPRNPAAPKLNDEAVTLISELCFHTDDEPQAADVIFVYASAVFVERLAETVHDLLSKGVSETLIITGGIPNYGSEPLIASPEAALLLNELDLTSFPRVRLICEGLSRNTRENVEYALRAHDFSQCKHIRFIFKAHAAGRGYLTLKQFCPEARLSQTTYAVQYDGSPMAIAKDNWFQFDFGRERVWGEVLRIKKYGERGDIAYPDVVRRTTDRIMSLVS